MISNIIILIILTMISFFPIVIWAYIFSHIDNNNINKKRFLVGLLGGAISVIPILYLDKILEFINFKYINIFYYLAEIKNFFSSLELGLSLSLYLILIVFFSILLGGLSKKLKYFLNIYLKNILIFLIFIFFLSTIIFFINLINIDIPINNSVVFGNMIFDSFKLILFYYLLVAFIEEASKHFNFLQSSILHINSIKQGVLYSIFVALGFSMIENILYLYNYYESYGITFNLIKIYLLRSSFSIIVHILSSSVIAYYFCRALLLYREKNLSLAYLKKFIFGLTISILLHLFFNISLTLGFSIVLFLYFIGGYLYVSSIFYTEDINK